LAKRLINGVGALDNKPIHETATEARAGSTPGVMRYVLGISLALIVVLFALVLIYWA
jgi:hypothetical protein